MGFKSNVIRHNTANTYQLQQTECLPRFFAQEEKTTSHKVDGLTGVEKNTSN